LLYVERSNRTENLLASLSRRWVAPRADPLQPSIVVVQGPGMERWIAQSLARDHGVCANTEFLFPRNLLERIFAACPVESVSPGDSRWEPEQLTWWLAKRLAAHRGASELAPLAAHLEAVDGDWRLVQLAQQIASLFDRYVTDRPEQVISWAQSDVTRLDRDERWQAWLFRGLVEDLGTGHLAQRASAFVEQMLGEDPERLGEALRARFPMPIEVFAVSTLSPLYLRVLHGLAQAVDVHLSILSPSRHYWAELWRELRDQEKAEAQGELPFGAGPGAAVGAIGGLLAGLGRLGADFQTCLEQISGYHETDQDLFEDPSAQTPTPSLLLRLQARLLELDDEPEGPPIARDDASIQVHLCHGPKRELEVVKSALRAAFDEDPTLTPEDVIVMAPDVDAIAPFVEAVFGVPGEDEGAIAHRIADRGTFRRSPVAEAFTTLLELLSGRAGRSEVIDWLARQPVRGRFGLDAAAVEKLADWAERAGVRFGLDTDHREALGLAAERGHTWSGGLDRLALAHAVGASDRVYRGLLSEPLDVLAEASWLGALGEVVSLLSDARRETSGMRSVSAWCRLFERLLDEAFERTNENAFEHAAIRETLFEIGKAASSAGFEAPIRFEAMRERVGLALEAAPPPQGFLSGGVTFCELVPLRAIPFRVVAILGLADTAFPRGRPAAGYDLIARHPKPGDRTPRHDDRHLFLEALLSARDRLILTVPGRDPRDGADLPPSVVVSELLDAVEACFDLEPKPGRTAEDEKEPTLREWLVVSHPVQAASPRYFEQAGDPRLIGRDAEAYDGARARWRALRAGDGKPRRFLDARPDPHGRESGKSGQAPHLTLDELIARILHSARHYSQERLGLRFPRIEDVEGDLDPVALEGFERYRLGRALLDHLEAGSSLEEAGHRLRANASMPDGVPGQLAAQSLQAEIATIVRLAEVYRGGEALPDLPVELTLSEVGGLGSVEISGSLRGLWPGGQVRLDFTRLRGRSELELWIRHVVLCALVEEGADREPTSILVARPVYGDKRIVRFARVEQPHDYLGRLFEWAWSVDRAPLPFFPKTSRVYAEKLEKVGPGSALREAHGALLGWETKDGASSELERELETRRTWEGWSPLSTSDELPVLYHFDELAREFFEPLIAARKELSE
jgi:exodeoxyribonuclease V gamma subunit